MNFPDDRPILACSTSTNSNAAIAVLRFSGFASLETFSKYLSIKINKIQSRYAHLVNIKNEDGAVLDQALLLYFEGPNSFTGENCLELHIHGNLLNIRQISELFTKNGDFRSASAGEFTYRALKNKKLDLSQVEGLDLMLNANSTLMLQKGLEVLHGDLHKMYQDLHGYFLRIKMALEMNVDFSEDIGEQQGQEIFQKACSDFKECIEKLHSKTQTSTESLLSPTVVLVGGTNAGKSTIFNEILSESRSIVSPVAGTTRDFITEYVYLDGTNFKVIDTAGIRITNDKIEEEGIKRALNILKKSFYKMLIINPFCYDKDDYFIEEESVDLVVITHCDQDGFNKKLSEIKLTVRAERVVFTSILEDGATGPIGPKDDDRSHRTNENNGGPIGPNDEDRSHRTNENNGGPIGPNDEIRSHRTSENNGGPIGPNDEIRSHRTSENSSGPIGPGSDLESLFDPEKVRFDKEVSSEISCLIGSKYKKLLKNDPIPIERHCSSINNIYTTFTNFNDIADSSYDFGILSSELNILDVQVSELIGITPVEDVLNSIFSNFCIGK